MKKIVTVLLIIAAVLYFFLIYDPEPVKTLHVNDEELKITDPVIEIDDVYYVQAQPVLARLGFSAAWEEDRDILTAAIGGFRAVFPLESNYVTIQGETVKLEAPLILVNEIAYIPLVPAAGALGILVEMDEDEGRFFIFTPKEFDPDFAEDTPTLDELAEIPEENYLPGEGPLLHVAYPPGNPTTYYGHSLFVFGTTSSYSQVEVTVNDEPVEIIDPRTGNFLTMVEIPRGEEFPVIVEAKAGRGRTTVERSVLYPAQWQAMTSSPLDLREDTLVPAANQVLKADDTLRIAFQGSPGATAGFNIGDNGPMAMQELAYPGGPPGRGGIYIAEYSVSAGDLPQSGMTGPMIINVTLGRDGEEIKRQIPGKVSFLAASALPYRIVEVKPEPELKNLGWLYKMTTNSYYPGQSTLGGSGYPTTGVCYLYEGTRYEAVGEAGNYYRIRFEQGTTHLVNKSAVRVVDNKGELKPEISAVKLWECDEKITLRLQSSGRFPFLVEDKKDGLTLNLYGPKTDENLTLPELTGGVETLSLKTASSNHPRLSTLAIQLDLEMTGFRLTWDQATLNIDMHKPQPVDKSAPLAGKTIIIDPGHGGRDTGAIGPGDVHEKDVVLAMSLHLKDYLVNAGAEVIMTRSEDIFVPLYDRPLNIDRFNPDLFISVHANAHAHDAPATKIHGLMTLYNYAHNKKLAEIMLDVMDDEMNLPRFRTWDRSVAVLRHTHIPGVLVEAGYMMHPDDNWYILHPGGQREFAAAMRKGIEEYFLSLDR